MKKNSLYKNSLSKNLLVKIVLVVVLISSSFLTLSGCSRGVVGYHIKSLPNKIVYQIGEKVDYSGLCIEAINSDETYSKFRFDNANISDVDTSTSGIKKVIVEKDNMSISFNIYVADIVVNDSDNIKDILQNTQNGDIVYLRAGNYVPKNNQDESYKDIVINKSLSIIGDGNDKTKLYGNFIVGANYENGVFTKLQNFKDVNFYGIGFELSYKNENNFLDYSGPYGKTDLNGAIRCFDTQNLNVQNCNFVGYAYGVLADNSNGLSVTNCIFKNILKSAIKTTTETQNCTIYKNLFIDIASNVIAFEGEFQSITGAVQLAFSSKGHKGVIVCKNLFNKIALHDTDPIFYDEQSKTTASNTTNSIYKYNYINNVYVISLLSSGVDDLEVTGIVLSANNYSQNPQIIYTGAKGKNTINANGVIVLD